MGLDVAILVGKTEDKELAAADQVEVVEQIGEPTTFRLRYPLSIQAGDFPLLRDGRLGPGSELTVVAPVKGVQHHLVAGQVYGQEIHMEHGGGSSWVEAIGGDLTMQMDREVKAKVWPPGTIRDVISGILAPYQVKPDVEQLTTKLSEADHLFVQRDTDLRVLRRLARRYGCWFWVSTDAMGINTGHFRRPQLTGSETGTLTIHLDGASLKKIDIEWDVERPTTAIASQLNLRTLAPIAGDVQKSPLPPLGGKAFASIAKTRGVQIGAPVDDGGDLKARSEAALIDGGWFLRARGETSARALGAVLRTHTVVKLDGMGTRHSGKYVVEMVRHRIDAAAHVMQFTLARNAWEA
jgi:phage protein D